MADPLRDQESLLFNSVDSLCEFAIQHGGASPLKRWFGRYNGIDALVVTSMVLHATAVFIQSRIPLWLAAVVTGASLYRILTMALTNLSILLRGEGKSTMGERIHSRLRYLVLIAGNYVEVVLFGALITGLMGISDPNGLHFGGSIASTTGLLLYNARIALLDLGPSPAPISVIGLLSVSTVAALGALLILVVLNIIVAVDPDIEVYRRGKLSPKRYWDWRALSFARTPWVARLELTERVVEHLLAADVQRVLDIGCGTGTLSRNIHYRGMSVTGCDSSTTMLAVAREQSQPTIDFKYGDAQALPIQDDSYDAAVLRMVLHNVDRWRDAVREAYRVVRPGGIVIVVEGFPPSDEARDFFQRVLQRVHERRFFSESQLTKSIEASGFQIKEDTEILIPCMSVKTWIASAIHDRSLQEDILKEHREMSEAEKSAYKAEFDGGDVQITLRFKKLVCLKPLTGAGVGE